jgi:hypothetical protein
MGLLARVLRLSGPTHGRLLLFLSAKSRRLSTHDTKPDQQPSSAWQARFSLDYRDLPILAKLPSALFDLEQLIECYLALIKC